MDKFSSVDNRVHVKLAGKLLIYLRIKTQLPEKLQVVSVVNGATTPKKMMWRVTEAPWRMFLRSLCCSFAAFSWF
jgi:hypothetical protein